MKKLKRKIVLAVFASTAIVFLLTIMLTGASIQLRIIHNADDMTALINSSGGEFPLKQEYDNLSKEDRLFLYDYDEESPYRMRYFVVYFSGDSAAANTKHIASIDNETAVSMARKVKDSGRETGFLGEYRYRIASDTNSVIFLDASTELDSMKSLLIIITLIAVFFITAITIIFSLFSQRIVRPFEENSKMQKQFITDASHELKTPLAIISANAEVLAYKDGENEWISNITEQVERIGGLINELLTLNRLEEIEENIEIMPVNLSEILTDTCEDFEEIFKKKNTSVAADIQKDITINANLEQIKRLFSVMIENASKYVSENGSVIITLKKEMRHTVFSIFNSCEIDKNVDYSHLCDRFYRPDASRTSQTGGHGIGLSIAKRIAVLHGGSIEAVPQSDGLIFSVTLSNRLKAGKNKKEHL